jgi:hypothetical protein
MGMKKRLREPTIEEERELNAVRKDSIDYVTLCGRKVGVRWLKRYTLRRMTDTSLTCKRDDELTSKEASLILLNGWWKIRLLHWLLWRVLWRRCSDAELSEVLAIGKKKVELQALQYLTAIMFLRDMRDTRLLMTKEEAENTLRALPTEPVSIQERSTTS